MTAQVDSGHRHLVPRWRYSRNTILDGEHQGAPGEHRVKAHVASNISELSRQWIHAQSLESAQELVAAAVVDPNPDIAKKAAEYVLAHEDKTSRELLGCARFVLGERAMSDFHAPTIGDSFELPRERAQTIVARGRRGLRDYPLNVPRRLDVARAYAILDQRNAALREMRIALALTPDHRVTLRLAARLLQHLGRKEQAHTLIASHPRTPFDPWLMATEIALATILGIPPTSIRAARQIIAKSNLPGSQLTELASAMGSIDSYNGDHKRGRKLHKLSLEEPNDNVLAQAHWLAQRDDGLRQRLTEANITIPGSMEAHCFKAITEERWSDALCHARAWHFDEPFSSRSAAVGSLLSASILQNYPAAIAMAEAGLQVDPDDDVLRNNLVFALARSGSILTAVQELRRLSRSPRRRLREFIFIATRGLVTFEGGDRIAGRLDYIEAANLADSRPSRLQVLASWAETEARHNTALSDDLYKRVLKAKEKVTDCISLAITKAFENTYAVTRAESQLDPSESPATLSNVTALVDHLEI